MMQHIYIYTLCFLCVYTCVITYISHCRYIHALFPVEDQHLQLLGLHHVLPSLLVDVDALLPPLQPRVKSWEAAPELPFQLAPAVQRLAISSTCDRSILKLISSNIYLCYAYIASLPGYTHIAIWRIHG